MSPCASPHTLPLRTSLRSSHRSMAWRPTALAGPNASRRLLHSLDGASFIAHFSSRTSPTFPPSFLSVPDHHHNQLHHRPSHDFPPLPIHVLTSSTTTVPPQPDATRSPSAWPRPQLSTPSFSTSRAPSQPAPSLAPIAISHHYNQHHHQPYPRPPAEGPPDSPTRRC